MNIPIAKAKKIREELGFNELIIFGVDQEGVEQVATHGKSQEDARMAAKRAEKIKEAMGWPEPMRKATPLPRKCKNCEHFRGHAATMDYRAFGPDGSGKERKGKCLYDRAEIEKHEDDRCHDFSPK